MVTTVADCVYGVLKHVLEVGASFRAAAYRADMCYNAGPLLSPKYFTQFLVPHYQRIATGKGHADKPAMIQAAAQCWPEFKPQTADEADARWIAARGAHMNGYDERSPVPLVNADQGKQIAPSRKQRSHRKSTPATKVTASRPSERDQHQV